MSQIEHAIKVFIDTETIDGEEYYKARAGYCSREWFYSRRKHDAVAFALAAYAERMKGV